MAQSNSDSDALSLHIDARIAQNASHLTPSERRDAVRVVRQQLFYGIAVIVVDAVDEMVAEEQAPRIRRPMYTDRDRGRLRVLSLLDENVHPDRPQNVLRMSRQRFCELVDELRVHSSLSRSHGRMGRPRIVSDEEKVFFFLEIVSHGQAVRTVCENYQHSTRTVWEAFQLVLKSLCQIHSRHVRMRPAEYSEIALGSKKVWPHFRNCIGAIDGTYLPIQVEKSDQPRWRNRKKVVTQNVVAIVDFHLNFMYVYAGCEGSYHDVKVLETAQEEEKVLNRIPAGCFVLGDAGYVVGTPQIMTPYLATRYHLQEYTARGPENAKELYNRRHSSLRNVVERVFGVFKNRFGFYRKLHEKLALKSQKRLVYALATLHNFINASSADLPFVDTPVYTTEEEVNALDLHTNRDGRDRIANAMWDEYVAGEPEEDVYGQGEEMEDATDEEGDEEGEGED